MARRKYKKGSKPESRLELDGHGWEVPDPRPLELPAGFRKPETLAETVRRLTRGHLSQLADTNEMDTFEEAEDFDLPDDPDDPSTPYEEFFDPVLGRGITAQEFKDNYEVYKQRYLDAEERAYREMQISDALRRPMRPDDPPARATAGESRAASERVSSEATQSAPPTTKPTSST